VDADADAGAGPGGSFRRLQRLGLQTQALKSALAAGLAWLVGAYVPWGPAQPYLAPLTAILTVQATIAESLQGALQRVLGVAVGVGIAVLASHTAGVSALTIVLLVVVSQAVGALLRLTIVGTSQVVISALLVLTVGQTTTSGWLYGWGRIAETMVGAAIGIAVNGLVIPPSYLPEVDRAWRTLAARLLDQLQALARDLEQGLSAEQARHALAEARAIGTQLGAAQAALAQAERALRFNSFGRAQRAEIGRYGRAVETLEHVAIQLRGIARVLSDQLGPAGRPAQDAAWLRSDALGSPLGRLIAATSEVLAAHGRLATDRGADIGSLAAPRAAAAEARMALLRTVRVQMPSMAPDALIAFGAILADLDRMVGDLASVSTWPRVPPMPPE
jgi:uncharacterized membrane protein YgaE (UPF0421/DUF939 family)